MKHITTRPPMLHLSVAFVCAQQTPVKICHRRCLFSLRRHGKTQTCRYNPPDYSAITE